MQRRMAGRTHKVGVDRDPWHPHQPFAGEHQRPVVAFLTRHARVHEDVLELSASAPAGGSHAQAGAAIAQPQVEPGLKVGRIGIAATEALPDDEARAGTVLRPRLCSRCDDLHVFPHDTKTQASGKVYTSAAPPGPRQSDHRSQMSAR